MPIDRSSGAHDVPGEQEPPGPESADQPVEHRAAESGPSKESGSWLNVERQSTEALLSFFGISDVDRTPANSSYQRSAVRDASETEAGASAGPDTHSEPAPGGERPEGSPDDQGRPEQPKRPDESRDGLRLTDEQLDEAQGWLRDNHPSPVENPGQGLKTWGVWWDDQGGSGADSSGRDERSSLAKTYLVEQGVPAVADLKHHLEMKIAAKMRAEEIQDVALVINNEPCEGMYSCTTWLGKVMPDGATLRVYGHDGTEYPLFRGEA